MNGRFLVKDLTDKEKQIFIRKFVVVPKVYEDRPITEWNVHFNATKEICFGNKREVCNDIIEIYDIIGFNSRNNTVTPRLAIVLDISTNQANQELKYNYEDILHFADTVESLMESSLNGIEGELK